MNRLVLFQAPAATLRTLDALEAQVNATDELYRLRWPSPVGDDLLARRLARLWGWSGHVQALDVLRTVRARHEAAVGRARALYPEASMEVDR